MAKGQFGLIELQRTELRRIANISHSATQPETAKLKNVVEGDLGDTVAIFGSTVTGVGIWGRAQQPEGLAANFEGDVALAGNLKVTGALHARGRHLFDGDVECTGDITLANADCAEDFDVAQAQLAEPGTVMVLSDDGAVSESCQAFDRRVAGVVSGAGDYKPGIVLDKRVNPGNRQPIALMGKVFCKVDAQFGAIEVGDLLTTSPTPGHAMKTTDPVRAFGAVIGKALASHPTGRGLIPILVAR